MTEFVTEQVAGSGRRSLEVDVFRPAEPNGVAVVLLHGGGWTQGHRSMMHGYATALSAQGFVAVAAEYRLLGEAPFPAQIDDIRDVVRWVKANAGQLGVDPAKVALQGHSAGGHLALLTAGSQPGVGFETELGDSTGTEVAAVVSFFAATRLDADPAAIENPPFSLLLNGGGAAAARKASPIYYVTENFPPTFLIGGMDDYLRPWPVALDTLQAFIAAGARVEFHQFHSQVHEFPSTPSMVGPVMAEVGFFYRRTLLDREALAAEAREHNPFARAKSLPEFQQMMAAGRPA